MIRQNESNRGEQIPAKQGEYEVGHKRPPKEHQFKPGQSGNPNGPPKRKTNLWVWTCKYMNMTDAELAKLDKEKLTQSQQTALTVVENARDGKPGFLRQVQYMVDRDEGRATQTQVVEDKRDRLPMTREELEAALKELDDLDSKAKAVQRQVNARLERNRRAGQDEADQAGGAPRP